MTAMSELGVALPVGRRPTGSVTCRWFVPAVPPAGNVDFGQPTAGSPAASLVEGQWYYLRCDNADGTPVREAWPIWTSAHGDAMADSWHELTATAAVPGLSAPVTATPVRTRWSMGDDRDEVVCDGPEAVYDFARDEHGQHTDCSHIYQWGSADQPGGTYSVTGYVDWKLGWTATNGARGTLADTSRGTSLDVHAAELEAAICYRNTRCS